jgi:putative ABC transport system permease protein
MTPSQRPPGPTGRIFRLLLRLYPRSFRARFGDEMTELFTARTAAAAGAAGRWRILGRATVDVVPSAWRERRRESLPLEPAALARGAGANLRDGICFVRRSPRLSLAIVLLTTMTIGAATIVFSVVNAVLLRPLPFRDPERLVSVWEARPDRGVERNAVSGHEFPVWNAENQAFDGMAAIVYPGPVTLTGAGEPKALAAVRVTSGFFDVMGVRPLLGRGFVADEDVPGHGRVVVLSESLWRERFGGDPNIAGRTIRLDGQPFAVVGVMPAGFDFPPGQGDAAIDAWSPIAEPIQFYRGRHYLTVVARLKPFMSIAQARDDMRRVAGELTRQFPDLNRGHEVRVTPLQQDLVRDARGTLLLLFGAVSCLVVIGCSNVAGLLLARGLARRHEIGVRLALGASRLGVARQLLAESLILSVSGAALGVLVTYRVTHAIPSLAAGLVPTLIPRTALAPDGVLVDTAVLGFALGAAIVTGILFGLAPAIQVRGVDLASVLQRGGRALWFAAHPRLRQGLVASQVALTLILVIGASLTARGLVALQQVDPGYSTNGILAADLALPASRYPSALSQRRFFGDLLARLSALPGVTTVAAASQLPLGGGVSGMAIDVEGGPASPGQENAARYRIVSTDYFRTLEIPVIAGRGFAPSDARLAVPLVKWFPQQPAPDGFDRPQAMPVAVVNLSMARQFWPGRDPIGRRFRALLSPWITVVGVAEDTRNEALGEPSRPEFYLHDLQEPQSGVSLLVRTDGDPVRLAPAVRAAVRDLDAGLAVTAMRPMADLVGTTLALPRLTSSLVGSFAVIALGLMVAGIYGLMAFASAERLPELGVRIALGADRAQVLRMMVGQGLAPGALGILVGLAGAAVLTRVLRSDVFGIPAADPLAWIAATVLLVSAMVAACWWPARRASRVDPVVVLRAQ